MYTPCSTSADGWDVETARAVVPAALMEGLPRDQALGLRLIALARAAAAVHMGETARQLSHAERGGTQEGEA